MATLKQDPNSNTTYLGWYGSCGEPKCVNFDLNLKKDIIRTVYQFTENGKGIRTFSSSAPAFLQGFNNLTCGNSYWIILKPGNSEVSIPEFTLGYDTNENLGLISSDCTSVTTVNPTPTPTPRTSQPCTKDVRQCPDGSFVSRNPKDRCRFEVCGWDSDEFRTRSSEWKYNEPMFYSFTFMYSGKLTSDRVKVTVRFGRIVMVKKINTNEEISLDYNDSISDEEHNSKQGRSRFQTPSQLFMWVVSHINTKGNKPFAVEIKYNEEFDYMESCVMTYKSTTKEGEAHYIGFKIEDFTEHEYKGKCPPHKKRCKDGTYVKRDPDNNCRFEECGESTNPTPTPDVLVNQPKMKFRWLNVDEYSILQIKNLPKPLEDGIYTEYRTVYGSNVLNPKDQKVLAWQHIKVSDDFVKAHKGSVLYYDMKFTFDSENENQLVVDLGQKTQFNRPQSNENEVSHLYFYRDDVDDTDYKLASTFPYIIKTEESNVDMDETEVVCTEDAKLCDDGTILVRDPSNNCEFPLCPEESDEQSEDDMDANDDGDEFIPPTDDPFLEEYEDDDTSEESNDFTPPTGDPLLGDNTSDYDETDYVVVADTLDGDHNISSDFNDDFIKQTDYPFIEKYSEELTGEFHIEENSNSVPFETDELNFESDEQ